MPILDGTSTAGDVALLGGIAGALLAANVSRPFFRVWPLGILSFAGALMACELAAHLAIAFAALAGVLAYAGALDSVHGGIGVALLALSVGAWIRLHRRGALVDAVAREAFAGQLGAAPADEPPPLRSRDVVVPIAFWHRRVVRRRNLPIAAVGGARLRADVFHRDDVPRDAPVLVYVHGGAWVVGRKKLQGLPLLVRLAARGWVCVSIDYRRGPRHRFPAHIEDVKRGIAWAKEHAHEFGGDPSFVVVAGNSAGGHLASLAALTPNRPDLQPGFEDRDTRVQGCVSFYGIYDFTNRAHTWPGIGLRPFLRAFVLPRACDHGAVLDHMSPLSHLHADAPPFLVVHGENDTLVPVAESRHFAAELARVSRAPVVFLPIPDAQHVFEIVRSPRSHLTLRAVERFLTQLRASHAEERVSPARTGSIRR